MPRSNGTNARHIACGSVASITVSPVANSAPAELSTDISLKRGSIGSVNQMITRSGASASSSSGAGSARSWFAWADASGAQVASIADATTSAPTIATMEVNRNDLTMTQASAIPIRRHLTGL